MQAEIGWTLLSREALRRAEDHLREDEQGVRDEIGFLALHQAYADRFFPGTSVLQTRIKYILFVPWIYERVAGELKHRQIGRIVEQEELDLARRLIITYGTSEGVIGARSYPKPTSQPPSVVYWNALITWGILRPLADGSHPSRGTVHRILSHPRWISRLQDDDKQPLEESRSLFVTLPNPPREWEKNGEPLSLGLSEAEIMFVRQQLAGVNRPGKLSGPSLLSRIAEHQVCVGEMDNPWVKSVFEVADRDDCEALLRAQQAAALAAIGRAVYAALVEYICAVEDKRPMPDVHRQHLKRTIEKYGREAQKLDMAAVEQDAPRPLRDQIVDVLSETRNWLGRNSSFLELRALYSQAEIRRKGRRARLARTLAGRERRAEWNSEDHPRAGRLHYRWKNIQRLFSDL